MIEIYSGSKRFIRPVIHILMLTLLLSLASGCGPVPTTPVRNYTGTPTNGTVDRDSDGDKNGAPDTDGDGV